MVFVYLSELGINFLVEGQQELVVGEQEVE